MVSNEEHVRCGNCMSIRFEDSIPPAIRSTRSRSRICSLPVCKYYRIAPWVPREVIVERSNEIYPVNNLWADGSTTTTQNVSVHRSKFKACPHVLNCECPHAKYDNMLVNAAQLIHVSAYASINHARSQKCFFSW
mmetsp:Transcript_7496/g.18059  ORF Transcript_7496/g.18059 Transcript_7496/m.18059 type:complete len:135 (-) Transcript_7496:908-1312(-)